MSNDNEFSIRSMRQILKSFTNKRVSDDAADELGNLVEHYGLEIAEEANEIADSDGRMTVRDSDGRMTVRDSDVVQALRNRGDL